MSNTLEDFVLTETVQKLAGDFGFTEGPVWHPDNYLLFSDIPASRINKYTPDSNVHPYLEPSGNSNGLTFDREGRLIACEHTGRRVSRQDSDGSMVTVADSWEGKKLNSPNDVVVHSNSRIFFTDPPYGISPEEEEIGFNGVYRIDPDGSVVLLGSDFGRPNGIAFSPDESILYVADTERSEVRAFDLTPNQDLSNDRVFIPIDVEGAGMPDGMKVDEHGNIYVTASDGVWVITPSAEHVGTITFPEQPANLAFGADDNKTLFVTARTGLYSVRVNVPGITVY